MRGWALRDTPEAAWLLALGARVSDGGTIDWDQAQRDALNADQALLVKQMRRLATVVAAHRSDGMGGTGLPAPSAPPPVRHWRHIVLFESIGAGAFGTVYRGWDPTLDRDVAVKLFPKGTAASTSPLDEARNLARIRHGNVVVVYGADREDDEAGIWMEYVEGRTLAQMVLDAGPMSAHEVTGIGVDLCRALAALHGAGLLHRDIKAQNVMREIGGRIVLMDFSGAEVVGHDPRTVVTSGTPLYMAPELFDNGVATPASEVYSLGILLFFLLTSRLPVEGATAADMKRAHAGGHRRRLRDLRPDVPDAIVQVIERAIAPAASARYQTAGELEHALATVSGSHAVLVESGYTASAADRVARSRGRTWSWITAAALTGVAVALAAVAARRGPPLSSHVTRFTVGPPFTAGSWPRVSPDGRFVVFGAIVEGRNRFWVRALDDVQGRALMNTTANESPFWSPDGRMLCFFADGKLQRIPIQSDGAQPEVLADAPQPHGGDWSGRTILFARAGGVYRIALEENVVVSRLTTVDESLGEYQHAWPELLPDGRRFLFVIRSSRPDRSGVYLASIDGGVPQRLMPVFSRVRYVDGHLLFVRQGILLAQRFDAASATLEGEPVPLADRVKFHAEGDGAFDVSESGVLVYGRSAGETITRLMVFDGRGRELQPLTPAGSYRHPRFSPDGQRVVAERTDASDRNVDLWLYDIVRGRAARLSSAPAPDVRPTWSPDGRRVAFSSKRGALYDVYSRSVDTTDAEQLLITAPGDKLVEDWSPDGRYLSGTVLQSGLWIYPLAGGKPWMVRGDAKTENWQSTFSPDGRWLAYTSGESGTPEVYVEPFPATGSRWQVSTHGGGEPHWRRSGRELLYLSPDGMLMAAGLTTEGWEKSRPIALFRISMPDLAGSGDYTVSPDGERIVVNTFISDPVIPPIDVVVNWTALLPR
jgi:eukaryotic-like serine/threonine-protein kinase